MKGISPMKAADTDFFNCTPAFSFFFSVFLIIYFSIDQSVKQSLHLLFKGKIILRRMWGNAVQIPDILLVMWVLVYWCVTVRSARVFSKKATWDMSWDHFLSPKYTMRLLKNKCDVINNFIIQHIIVSTGIGCNVGGDLGQNYRKLLSWVRCPTIV